MRKLSLASRRRVLALVVTGIVLSTIGGSPLVARASRAPVHPSTSRATVAPSRAAASLGPLENIVQTWNNCGPASVAEVLSYWGIQRTQAQVQSVLRADGSPGGMGPFGVPSYARSLGMASLMGVEGTPTVIKALVSNGFPVIVSQMVSVSMHVGHYRPIEGYNDRQGVFISSDPYMGPDYQISYSDFSQIWTTRREGFFVIYPPSKQALLNAVLASAGWNKTRAYRADLAAQLSHANHNQFGGDVAYHTGHGGYQFYNKAWDQVELGQYAAARQTLAQARRAGANAVVLAWIAGEIPA